MTEEAVADRVRDGRWSLEAGVHRLAAFGMTRQQALRFLLRKERPEE